MIRAGSAILLCMFLAGQAWGGNPPTVQEVTRKLDDLYRSAASVKRIELLSKTETQTRHLKLRAWTKGKDKSLIVIDEPAREAGTATLKVGQNLWNYLPKISRTIRVPPSMMLSSWMGTDLTNDDLVQDTSYEHDFDTASAQPSSNPPGWLFAMKVKPGIVGRWDKIEWIVTEDSWVPVQAKYYDRKGRLARTMRFTDIKTLGGRAIPVRLLLDSVDQPGHVTELVFLEANFDATVPDGTFSLSALERQ